MPIEFFDKGGRGFVPKASIRSQGQIGLNQGAVHRFDLKNGDFVVLGYDKENRMIAIKPCKGTDAGSKRLVVRSKNGSISAKSFFDYFEIPYKKLVKSYPLDEDKRNECLVFFLGPERGTNNITSDTGKQY